jgi:hypothetical protein
MKFHYSFYVFVSFIVTISGPSIGFEYETFCLCYFSLYRSTHAYLLLVLIWSFVYKGSISENCVRLNDTTVVKFHAHRYSAK